MIDKNLLIDWVKNQIKDIEIEKYNALCKKEYGNYGRQDHGLVIFDILMSLIIKGQFDFHFKPGQIKILYPETCQWKFDSEDGDVIYETSCGNVHQFIEGNIKDNDHVYCPYCGLKIEEVKYE